jgi:hypothetical protein
MRNRVSRSRHLALGAITALALSADGPAADEHPTPPGCHWQAIPELRAHLAVPDGWEFRVTPSSGALSYEVRPAGPGFVGMKARFRLRVERTGDPEAAVARARDHVERARGSATEAPPAEEQRIGALLLFSAIVTFVPPVPGVEGTTSAVSSVANGRTGTLYLMRFDIPVGEMESVAPPGNHLFRELRLDGGI